MILSIRCALDEISNEKTIFYEKLSKTIAARQIIHIQSFHQTNYDAKPFLALLVATSEGSYQIFPDIETLGSSVP